MERQALITAMDLAKQRIAERTSFYRQEWLLNGQPETLDIDGQRLTFTSNGWVIALNRNSELDCQLWFHQVYPDNKLLGLSVEKSLNTSVGQDYQCDYNYGDEALIKLKLINNNFSIYAGFKAE
ncbi:MSHA biogenesis protein MshF [Vibrio sonorensis]|uniref:MSHA biogenesis protein MshF n=1 Tax=Vibrio sonorensis TaxID=1004316 RepID=UPI001C3009D0|nr:MSHA biogenesis protein MshF [Vibrio sonorensis]